MTPVNKICKKCGGMHFYNSGGCKACDAERVAKYRKNNNEKIKAKKRAIYALNPEKSLASTKAWTVKNLNMTRLAALKRYALNPEKYIKEVRIWQSKNKEKVRAIRHNRRAKKRVNGGRLSVGLVAKLLILQKGKCPCCGLHLGNDYHIDHIFPIALGGSNSDDNIQLLRQRCNNQKHAKHPVDFMQSRGFLL